MRPEHDDADEFENADVPGQGIETSPSGLAHWLAEQYAGDDRFASIEVEAPGPLEEEAVRVKFICEDNTHFMVAVLAEDAIVRIGLATEDKDLAAVIQEAAEEAGGVLTDLLSDGVEDDEELEHEAEHFHDDMDYFCSDIPYQRDEDLAADILRDAVIFYLDAYLGAFYELMYEEED